MLSREESNTNLQSLIWPDQGSNQRSTTLKSLFTNDRPQFSYQWYFHW